jgi:hypothetical protein
LPSCLLLLLPASAGHLPPPFPLLDASIATCYSHLLQLLVCACAQEAEGARRGLPTCSQAVGQCGLHVGRHGMQVRGGRQSAGVGVRTSGR